MELIYNNRLVHYLGPDACDGGEESVYQFSFRDSSGERFSIAVPESDCPVEFVSLAKRSPVELDAEQSTYVEKHQRELLLQRLLDQHEQMMAKIKGRVE